MSRIAFRACFGVANPSHPRVVVNLLELVGLGVAVKRKPALLGITGCRKAESDAAGTRDLCTQVNVRRLTDIDVLPIIGGRELNFRQLAGQANNPLITRLSPTGSK